MELSQTVQKKKRIVCPECSNYILGIVQPNGAVAGKCNICKSVVSSRQCNSRETHIKIIKSKI